MGSPSRTEDRVEQHRFHHHPTDFPPRHILMTGPRGGHHAQEDEQQHHHVQRVAWAYVVEEGAERARAPFPPRDVRCFGSGHYHFREDARGPGQGRDEDVRFHQAELERSQVLGHGHERRHPQYGHQPPIRTVEDERGQQDESQQADGQGRSSHVEDREDEKQPRVHQRFGGSPHRPQAQTDQRDDGHQGQRAQEHVRPHRSVSSDYQGGHPRRIEAEDQEVGFQGEAVPQHVHFVRVQEDASLFPVQAGLHRDQLAGDDADAVALCPDGVSELGIRVCPHPCGRPIPSDADQRGRGRQVLECPVHRSRLPVGTEEGESPQRVIRRHLGVELIPGEQSQPGPFPTFAAEHVFDVVGLLLFGDRPPNAGFALPVGRRRVASPPHQPDGGFTVAMAFHDLSEEDQAGDPQAVGVVVPAPGAAVVQVVGFGAQDVEGASGSGFVHRVQVVHIAHVVGLVQGGGGQPRAEDVRVGIRSADGRSYSAQHAHIPLRVHPLVSPKGAYVRLIPNLVVIDAVAVAPGERIGKAGERVQIGGRHNRVVLLPGRAQPGWGSVEESEDAQTVVVNRAHHPIIRFPVVLSRGRLDGKPGEPDAHPAKSPLYEEGQGAIQVGVGEGHQVRVDRVRVHVGVGDARRWTIRDAARLAPNVVHQEGNRGQHESQQDERDDNASPPGRFHINRACLCVHGDRRSPSPTCSPDVCPSKCRCQSFGVSRS